MAQFDTGNGFSVNFDDIPNFIAALQDQHDRLQQIWQDQSANLVAPPPANDGQSAGWSQQAQSAVSSYQTWNQARRTELKALIDKANAAFASYKQTDQNNMVRP